MRKESCLKLTRGCWGDFDLFQFKGKFIRNIIWNCLGLQGSIFFNLKRNPSGTLSGIVSGLLDPQGKKHIREM